MALMFDRMDLREAEVVISRVEGMVLDAIANDYEEIDEIVKDVARFGIEEKMHLKKEDIVIALRHLTESGLANGYRLGVAKNPVVVSDIEWGNVTDVYFYVSAAGKGVLRELSGD